MSSIIRRLFARRGERGDRPSDRGPLVVVNIFVGLDATAGWVRGLLRRRRRVPASEAPRRSMPSSFIGGGRSRALSELDSCIPNEPRRSDRGAGPVMDEAEPATDPAPPVRIYLGRLRRGE
jgi:hypothetical protein